MRTIEEVREYVKTEWKKIEDADVSAIRQRPHCQACLLMVLEFIDSEPPCKHPNILIYKLGDPFRLSSGKPAKFCPDCGAELEVKE